MTDESKQYEITAEVEGDTEEFERKIIAALERPEVVDWNIQRD